MPLVSTPSGCALAWRFALASCGAMVAVALVVSMNAPARADAGCGCGAPGGGMSGRAIATDQFSARGALGGAGGGAMGPAAQLIPAVRNAHTATKIVNHFDLGPAYRSSRTSDLFYNFYANGGEGVPASMYPSPRPVPPLVGHTYYTYQPLYPHEYMYSHKRTYWTHRPTAGWVRTKVKYSSFSPVSSFTGWFHSK